MRGEAQGDGVPPDVDVGVVVGGLGQLAHLVHPVERLPEPTSPSDFHQLVSLALPVQAGQRSGYGVVVEQLCAHGGGSVVMQVR